MVQYTFRDEIDYAKRIIERDNRDIDVSWALELGKETKDLATNANSRYGVKEVSPISIANKEVSPTLFIDKEDKKAQLVELKINWEVIEVDFSNKRSLVQMELVLFSQENIYSNTEKFGELDGQYFMYKNGWRGKCNNALCYKSIWIEHGKVKFVEASLDINMSLGGLYIGTLQAQEFISLNYIA